MQHHGNLKAAAATCQKRRARAHSVARASPCRRASRARPGRQQQSVRRRRQPLRAAQLRSPLQGPLQHMLLRLIRLQLSRRPSPSRTGWCASTAGCRFYLKAPQLLANAAPPFWDTLHVLPGTSGTP